MGDAVYMIAGVESLDVRVFAARVGVQERVDSNAIIYSKVSMLS